MKFHFLTRTVLRSKHSNLVKILVLIGLKNEGSLTTPKWIAEPLLLPDIAENFTAQTLFRHWDYCEFFFRSLKTCCQPRLTLGENKRKEHELHSKYRNYITSQSNLFNGMKRYITDVITFTPDIQVVMCWMGFSLVAVMDTTTPCIAVFEGTVTRILTLIKSSATVTLDQDDSG